VELALDNLPGFDGFRVHGAEFIQGLLKMSEERVRAVVRGAVQGVGFRPFVYRLARATDLRGWVLNSANGVFIEAEGERTRLDEFILRLEKEKPPRAIFQSFEFSFLEPAGYEDFVIRESDGRGEKSAFILPDIAPCADCLKEIFDPNDRRHFYPFTNCTNCGPRFSIIESLPYDRVNTSMKHFMMCNECEREYHDPVNRRFHAEPTACPKCGPRLALWNQAGDVLSDGQPALVQAAKALREGKIVALKGVGGFQLVTDARNEGAVRRLRSRKYREEKPFAVMYPSIALVAADCQLSEAETRLLNSPEAPIVLLEKRAAQQTICGSVAPGNPNLGVMLPSSPLHHLLLRELDFPVVATSGNLNSEPICIDENEALARLSGIADLFLVHDRPIVRAVDDSIARIILNREMILRRARGYAPLPIRATDDLPAVLAVGSHLKNTVAICKGGEIFLSQHIGDLETAEAMWAFRKVTADLQSLYDFKPDIVACDLHPEYLSTRHAKTFGKPVFPVQHHYAHVLSCMAENEMRGSALGVAWDGTGFGPDGTIWGGEFLLVNDVEENDAGQNWSRYAHFRHFPLPGGESAIRCPARIAIGFLWPVLGDEIFAQKDFLPLRQFSPVELRTIRQALNQGLNAPLTSSAGRLFDAVASLAGICQSASFEGQAAMALEFAINHQIDERYVFELAGHDPIVIDPNSMIAELLDDVHAGTSAGVMAAKFHNTMVAVIVEIALRSGQANIVLSGGCFQNKYLLERTILQIRHAGLKPFWHQRVPTNDGGIALGQTLAAGRHLAKQSQTKSLRTRVKTPENSAVPV
jgi:hydrogenase maturation protein HypF